jgi:hypothetical protein
MMLWEGTLEKMAAQWGKPVTYRLGEQENACAVHELVGTRLCLEFLHEIHCIVCGRKTKKAFGQGFCYPCFIKSPENAECIIRPELCRGHLGEGRDVEWEKAHHVQPHVVYLAQSSGIKVGVTRSSQVPTRWIDQGASAALVLAETPNRFLAGCLEVALKKNFTDKTDWRKMLVNAISAENLLEAKEKAYEHTPEELKPYLINGNDITYIEYPVVDFPTKPNSISLDKQEAIVGKLMGIKGQYWIWDNNRVWNLRNHSGYRVRLSREEEP